MDDRVNFMGKKEEGETYSLIQSIIKLYSLENLLVKFSAHISAPFHLPSLYITLHSLPPLSPIPFLADHLPNLMKLNPHD